MLLCAVSQQRKYGRKSSKKQQTEIAKLQCIYFLQSYIAVTPYHIRNPLTKDINGNIASKDGTANHDLLQIMTVPNNMYFKDDLTESKRVVCFYVRGILNLIAL